MQPTGSGGGPSRGLARFRSAPATCLEALLESEEVEVEEESILDLHPPPKPTTTATQYFTPPSTAAAANKTYVDPGLFNSPGSSAFLRQNSSPAEFLAQISSGSDGYFSNFGIPANYDYLPSSKRPRETGEKSGELHDLLDAEMKKLLEDSVPCRIRAKRGCATHPRSIAERVRRTRISDRIRKLQELVPNMDKQTNTTDMLDEAVEYVKLLQKQIQISIISRFPPPDMKNTDGKGILEGKGETRSLCSLTAVEGTLSLKQETNIWQELTDHEKKCVYAARN